MVIIDSDVFLMAYRFQRDERAEINMRFLAAVQVAAPALFAGKTCLPVLTPAEYLNRA